MRNLLTQAVELAPTQQHQEAQQRNDPEAHEAERRAELVQRLVVANSRGGRLTLCSVGIVVAAAAAFLLVVITGNVCSAIASISLGWTLLVRVFWIQYAAPASCHAIVRISSPA